MCVNEKLGRKWLQSILRYYSEYAQRGRKITKDVC
jgi:hypothetical protein